MARDDADVRMADPLSRMEDALGLRDVERAWRLYLSMQARVPVSYRIELARLLKHAAIDSGPAVQQRNAARLWQMLREWPSPGIVPSMTEEERRMETKRVMQARRGCVHAYLSIISTCEVDKAEQLVEDMLLSRSMPRDAMHHVAADDDADGCGPTMLTLQKLMRLQSMQGRPDLCQAWMRRFQQEHGIRADSICWHWLVNAWMQANQPRNAVTLAIRHMPSEGVKVFQQTWLMLLRGLHFGLTIEERAQRIPHRDDLDRKQAAHVLLDHLDRICGGQETRRHHYTLHAHAPEQAATVALADATTSTPPDDRWRLFVSEYPLNESVLATAMALALLVGEMSLARRFRHRANMTAARHMFQADPAAAAHAISTIVLRKEVHYWCHMGNYKAAERALDRLPLERRYQRKLVTAIMKAARRAGQPADAVRLFETARRSGLARMDAHAWTCLIAAHADQMDLAAAQKAFRDMWTSGIKAGVVGYTALLVAYGKCGELANAERILQAMQAEETATLATLGLDEQQQPSMAEKAPRPNAITRCALADAFAKCNEIERTIEILLQNRDRLSEHDDGVAHDPHAPRRQQVSSTFSLNTIMSALNRAGRPHDVLRLWWAAFEGGASSYDQPLHHGNQQRHVGGSDRSIVITSLPADAAHCKTWNFGSLAITLDTCAWHNLGQEGEQVWREATRDLLARQGWDASPLRSKDGRRICLTRHCWYSYIGLLGRTHRARDIPHALVTMMENGRWPNKPLLLHACAFLAAAQENEAIEYIREEMHRRSKRLNGPLHLILPTDEEIAAYLGNRQ
ncbi:hypothetical protein SYNPS1DRAFT_28787 [Syncephalis pseudoplumigaleata]|uniref:Pentacotripeptide-repeat region of PRORP domain-containing protein n=1 Tax=Syncephalis pseudoplumigaleata TaxID=1712513 RepID=A0A4P9YZG0_9FUNG|nr:hypothetical protein SYNPS1DRAFT_28787 [Syncephalis pseudoplumigaleata]|eukprot:RKP25484.1 hypothetical protein SYNPS1DRAFT_28787 [Syncephalis pseudoplumigaleata]